MAKVVHPRNGQIVEVSPERAAVFRQRGYTDYKEPKAQTADYPDEAEKPKRKSSYNNRE